MRMTSKTRFSKYYAVCVGEPASFWLACSTRSDSGERCEVKKAMKSRGGLGREVRVSSLTSPPPSLVFFRARFYFAPLPTI